MQTENILVCHVWPHLSVRTSDGFLYQEWL